MAFQGADGDITVIKLSADRESIQIMARLTPDAATDFVLN
jgi:paraquat-inducible protein B